jgi:hypothetical protein
VFYKKPPESSRDYLNELKVLEVCEFLFALRCHMCILWSSLKAYLILSAARPLQGTQTGLLFHRTRCVDVMQRESTEKHENRYADMSL